MVQLFGCSFDFTLSCFTILGGKLTAIYHVPVKYIAYIRKGFGHPWEGETWGRSVHS